MYIYIRKGVYQSRSLDQDHYIGNEYFVMAKNKAGPSICPYCSYTSSDAIRISFIRIFLIDTKKKKKLNVTEKQANNKH